MTSSIFKACYSEWKLIKTRGAVQIVFEMPVEQSDAAYQALGGMPVAAREVWCAIARLKPESEVMPPEPVQPRSGVHSERSTETQPQAQVSRIEPGAERRKSPAQIAGYLCTTRLFQTFLQERFPVQWNGALVKALDNTEHPLAICDYTPSELAAECVREICSVSSRSRITPDNADWSALLLAFRLWENHPEFEDA